MGDESGVAVLAFNHTAASSSSSERTTIILLFFSNIQINARRGLPEVSYDWKLRRGGVGLLWSDVAPVDVQSLVAGQSFGLGDKVHGLSEDKVVGLGEPIPLS